MTLVAEPAETREALAEAFAEAEPFETYWANRAIVPWTLRQEISYQLSRLAKWIGRQRDAQTQGAGDD